MFFKYNLASILLLGLIAQGLSQESKVCFSLEDAPNVEDYRVGLRGSVAPLSWDETIFLVNGSLKLDFRQVNDKLEYKYVLDNGEDVKWEGIANREVDLTIAALTLNDTWNKETPVDISSLADISSSDLLEDFKMLEEMILRVHPGTYRYSTEGEIKATLNELKNSFSKPLSIGEAYLAMSKVTATIKCDHTMVGFNNQNKYVNTVIHEQPDKLPFTFKWFGNRMIIDMNASLESSLKKGVEILSINGTPVAEILTSLIPYVAADGGTDKNRVRKLEVDGFDFRYNAFDVFYPLKFPSETNTYKLKLKNFENEITVNGVHREARAKLLKDKYPDFPFTRDDTWKFEIRDNLGVLTLNSFGLMGWKAMTIDYKQFFEDTFEKIKKQNISNLVIDIRKNTGGNDEIKKELFTYLSFNRNNIKPSSREGRTRFTKFPEILKPHIKTWGDNPWYFNLEPDATNGIYYVFNERLENRKPSPPKTVAFSGNIFLLVSSSNTSLAFYTARDFQHYKIGQLIGEETGGNLRDINGGQILFLTLPNSGIEIDFPVMGGFSKGNLPNTGVLPDYKIDTSLDDFINGEDQVMQKVMNLINQ